MNLPLLLRALALSLILTVGSLNVHSQWVSIPDTNFGKWLNTNGYVACMQGNSAIGWQMDTSCPAVVNATYIKCNGKSIRDLAGIQYFNNLDSLLCYTNLLSELPPLPGSLSYLNCSHNQIDSLRDFSSTLLWLDCGYNPLQTLPDLPDSLAYMHCGNCDIIALPPLPQRLKILYCGGNQLASLPVLPDSLRVLDCSYNLLSALPSLPNYVYSLSCTNNQITSLPNFPARFNTLSCQYNQLTSLPDFPNGMLFVNCVSNQLTSLPELPNTVTTLHCALNLQLTSLPELPDYMSVCNIMGCPITCLPQLKEIVNLYFSNTNVTCLPNYGRVSYSTPSLNTLPLCDLFNNNDCKVFWNISGKTYYDSNNNCLSDANEGVQKNVKLLLKAGNNILAQTFSGQDGFYSFDTDTSGIYQVSVDTTASPFYINCPGSGFWKDTISAIDSLDYSRDFAIECKPAFDLTAFSISTTRFRPGAISDVRIQAGDITNFYGVHCSAGLSGVVTVTIIGPATFVAPANGALTPSVNGNVLTYNISDFGAVNFNGDFNSLVQTDVNTMLGSQVCFTVSVTPTVGDNNPANNRLTQCFTVVGSFDPNDKAVSPPGNIDTVQEWLTYTVRFQNTGTAEAQHIYITDTLDTDLDVSSFQLLAYSHQPMVQITGNAVRFNYPNINLPDSNTNEPLSHGYVQYRVRLNNNLAIGAEVNNTAFIYFDFNAPVITNTVTNTVIDTAGTCLATSSNIADTICSNELYFFGGALITSGGVYYNVIPNSNGCDSVIQLILTVRTAYDTYISATICESDSYFFDGHLVDTAGVYYELHPSIDGCDSLIELTLSVIPTARTYTTAEICMGDSLAFGNQVLYTSGVYTDAVVGTNICDSVVYLTLTVHEGPYLDTLTVSQTEVCACQDIVHFSLATVGAVSARFIEGCGGAVNFMDSITPVGTAQNPTIINFNHVYCIGPYCTPAVVLFDSFACRSIYYLPTINIYSTGSVFRDTICNGDSCLFAGQLLTTSGVYYDTLQNVLSCDSIVRLNLVVLSTSVTNISGAFCDGETYSFGGQLLNTAGNYTDTLANANGCDSVVHLSLVELSVNTTIIDTTITQGSVYTLPSGGTVTTAGTYVDTLVGSNTCDSIVTVNLTVISGITKSEIANPQFTIFPNPASDVVTISIDESMIGSIASITDITGRKVAAVPLSTVNCPLSTATFESGVYFVTVTDKENRSATKKLVISR